GVINAHIADNEKTVRQLAIGRVEQGEIFLVQPHRQNQAFRRNRQKLGIELANINRRQLNQRGDFVQERFDLVVDAQVGAKLGGFGVQLIQNGLLTAFVRCNDLAFVEQLIFIRQSVANHDIARAEKAVALRSV